MKAIKRYLCVVCEEREIIESIASKNVHLSRATRASYLEGGSLLEHKPKIDWENPFLPEDKKPKPPKGAICSQCLKNKIIEKLTKGGHILFDESLFIREQKAH